MQSPARLEMSCKTNPDYNGRWLQRDVSEEMEELGMSSSGDDWIEYIISHFDFTAEIDQAICNDSILEITFAYGPDIVKVRKSS